MVSMKHEICKAKREDYTTPIKTKHEMASPTKIRVISWKNTPKKHIEMIARKLRHEGIHNGSCLRHKDPTFQSMESVTHASV